MSTNDRPSTVEEYLSAQPEPKQSELRRLHALIRQAAPQWEPFASGGMVGYGAFHYRYASGREGDTFHLGLSANKTGISVYVNVMNKGGYLPEQAAQKLGKATIGKSCIRFKRLADLNLVELEKLIKAAALLKGAGLAE